MDRIMSTTRNEGIGRGPALVLLAVAGPVLYGLGLWCAGTTDGTTLGTTVCFDPAIDGHHGFLRSVAAVAMATGAIWLLFFTPWALGTLAIRRIAAKRATAGAWSLAVNSAALMAVCLVLRGTVGIDRFEFLTAWMAWTGVLAAAAWKSATGPGELRTAVRRWGLGWLIGLAAVLAAAAFVGREQFLHGFNGDGVEMFELARSLKTHFLPYFEIEAADRFGTVIVSPALISSYWTLAVQLLLGESELATRLPFWIWWLGIFAASLGMVGKGNDEARMTNDETLISRYSLRHSSFVLRPFPFVISPAIPLAALLLLATLWYAFYVGYCPYVADLSGPGVFDALFTLLTLLGLDCLRKRDVGGWVVMTVMASLVLYAGPVMFVLVSVAALVWRPVPRREMCIGILTGATAIVALTIFYAVWGWLDGSISGWWDTLMVEYVHEYFYVGAGHGPQGGRLASAAIFAGYFLLGCGGIGALGLVGAFRPRATGDSLGPGEAVANETAWQRSVATMVLAYLVIILCAGSKNLHYLGPLLPITLVLWLQQVKLATGRRWLRGVLVGLTTAGLIASIAVSWPRGRSVFELNRQLGAMTTFKTDSYEEACRWARITWNLYDRELLGWRIGPHTWVHYGQCSAARDDARPLVVTAAAVPAGYVCRFESPDGVKFCTNNQQARQWIAAQRPADGLERSPLVYRPIAVAARPQKAP